MDPLLEIQVAQALGLESEAIPPFGHPNFITVAELLAERKV